MRTAGRLDRRQGLLISATIHLMILTLLATEPRTAPAPPAPTPTPAPSPREARRVLLVPRSMVPELMPAPAPPPARDRISIGPPSDRRREEPLVLRRDQDLTSEPAGPGQDRRAAAAGVPSPALQPAPPPARPGPEGAGRAPGADERPIGRALRDLDRRLGQMGVGAMPGGAGRQMGPLFFDPQGADFTAWINHFKNEVYRNWIVPQAALFGLRGHADFEFTVERDGRLTGLRLLKSSGTPALDRAAQNALMGSRLLALPADYAPPSVRMQVSFFYNEGPQG